SASPPPSEKRMRWTLRWNDQWAAVLVLLILAAAATVETWRRQTRQSQTIDIEQVEPQPVRFIVDINQADWPELTQLPGIGETLAKRIVDSRKANGPFLDHQDLQRVQGIGPRTMERLCPYLLPTAGVETVAGDSSVPGQAGS
ncbi:MAG: ComEA family DNA-binding protein, partial [Blastopirellula sp. JB062]